MGVAINPSLAGSEEKMQRASKEMTFDGSAGKGAIGAGTLFTVTGEVLIEAIVGFCKTAVDVDAGTGIASMQLGHTNLTSAFIATTPAIDIDAGEFWIDATPDADMIAVPAALKDFALSQDIKFEVTSTGTKKVNAGVIRFDVWWRPLSPDGNLIAA